ncbi:MAG: ribonuclease HII [Paracoccaceae bacterium]
MRPDFAYEEAAFRAGARCVVGVDEVGRGPLAGPVTAAAVRLDPGHLPDGLRDSKALSAAARNRLHDWLLDHAQVSVAHATVEEIDALNILRASHLAMERAIAALTPAQGPHPDHALIDGNLIPRGLTCPAQAIVKGDAYCMSIAAASIVAKVARDRIMVDLAQQHPQYGWDRNAGYPTKAHFQALLDFGVTPFHRRSFGPVHKILCQANSVTP